MIGSRTIAALARAAIPSRQIVIMAAFAVVAAVGVNAVAWLAGLLVPRLGAWLSGIATTFSAMPLWVLIGGGMSQFAARTDTAITDVIAWWRASRSDT